MSHAALADHADEAGAANRKLVIASYPVGSRERLAGLLADHGLKRLAQVDGVAGGAGAAAGAALR